MQFLRENVPDVFVWRFNGLDTRISSGEEYLFIHIHTCLMSLFNTSSSLLLFCAIKSREFIATKMSVFLFIRSFIRVQLLFFYEKAL